MKTSYTNMAVTLDSKVPRKVHFDLPTIKNPNGMMNHKATHSTKQYINGMLVSSSNITPVTQQNLQPTIQQQQQQNFMITRSSPNLCKLQKTQNYLSSSCTPDVETNIDSRTIIPPLPKIEMSFSSSMTNLTSTPYDTHMPQYNKISPNYDTLFLKESPPRTLNTNPIDTKKYLTVPEVSDYDNDDAIITGGVSLYNKSSTTKLVQNEMNTKKFFTNETNHKKQAWSLFDRWRIGRNGANSNKSGLNNKNSTQNASVSSHIYFKPHDKR